MVARGLVLVHAGQPVAQQRALDIMLRRRARPVQINSRKSLVNRAVQAQRARGHGYPLGLHLRLVADSLFGGHGVQHAGLRPGQTQLFDGRVIKPQRVFRRALTLHRQ